MPSIVQNSSQYQAIQSTYLNQVVTGNELSSALASGTDPTTALQQFAGDVATFAAVLPPGMIQQNTATLQQNYANIVSDQMLDSGTANELNLTFSDSKGNLDDGKLNALIQQIQQQDPQQFTDADGKPLPPDKIVNAFKQVWDEVRGGAKVTDALKKLDPSITGIPGVQDLYSKGILHAVSALFAGGVLAGKAAEGAGSPTADVSIAASAATLVGTTMEASTKYASGLAKQSPDKTFAGLSTTQLKQIESAGKVVGGLGSVAGGVLGIIGGVGQIASGDKVDGGFSLAGGITGILGGGTGIAEAGVGIADSLGVGGLEAISAGLGAVAGGLSIVTAAIGFIGLIVYGFVELAKEDKKEDQFQGEVLPVLNQYGITGGPVTPSDEPVNPIPSSGD
jgi:trimeric autotransporter adhesin